MSGTIVGIVEKANLLDGRKTKPGDVILGFPSNGLHTNGYTLAREIFFGKLKLKPSSKVPELGSTVGNELLKVHQSYLHPMTKLLKRFNAKGTKPAIKGFAHITGGGFIDNIPRILPDTVDAKIFRGSWDSQPVFQIIQKVGKVSELEMHTVFNMGIGMISIVDAKRASDVQGYLKRIKQPVFEIGSVSPGTGKCMLA